MACFTPAVLQSFLIWLVFVIAVIAIVNLVVPWVLAQFGNPDGGIVVAILRIIIWALVAIAVIVFVFDLLSCTGLFAIRR
jgi:hypothetical protein